MVLGIHVVPTTEEPKSWDGLREGLEGRETWEEASGQGDGSEHRRMVAQEPRVNTSPFE